MTELTDIVDTFELLGDWDQRYQYLMELGDTLPTMPDELKTEENHVKPCMSTVHVCAVPDTDRPDHIRYLGDCDTAIIKGVLAVLISLCNGKTAKEINALDMDQIFEQLQLGEHLSPNRHVGIYAIFELMKQQAQELRRTNQVA
jgi:cysteine desulfuration protein SufE